MARHRSIVAPALRLGIAGLFATVPRLFCDVEVHGLELDPRAPHTYYAITHKRDLDSIAPLPIILGRHGWRALTNETHFAMRADSCTPGFLARVIEHPEWLAHLLRPLRLGSLLRAVGVHPIQGWRGRPAEEWLRECLLLTGDQPAGQVLSERFLHDMAAAAHEDPERTATRRLSAVLRWRYHDVLRLYYGPEILSGAARRTVERAALAAIKAQLADIAAWLRDGGSIYSSPEGVLSPDGRLSPISAGFHRIIRMARADVVIQPVAITYDFMTAARPHMFIDLAPAIERPAALRADALDALLRERWLRAARLGMTQLAAPFLVAAEHERRGVTVAGLAEAVMERARALHALGRHVDARLLHPLGARRIAASYLTYARGHGLVKSAGDGGWIATIPATRVTVRFEQVGYHAAPLAYAWNELRELLSVEPSIALPPYEPPQRISAWTNSLRSAAPAH